MRKLFGLFIVLIFAFTSCEGSKTQSQALSEDIKFFTEYAQSSGWTLGSSTISEMVLLVFNNDKRIATVEISKGKKSLFSFSKTKVKIAINHPNSIKEEPDTIAELLTI